MCNATGDLSVVHVAVAGLLVIDEIRFSGASPPFAPTWSVNEGPANVAVASIMKDAVIAIVSFLDIYFLRSALGFGESRSTERVRRRPFVESSFVAQSVINPRLRAPFASKSAT